jgi:CHAT domain-containing protein
VNLGRLEEALVLIDRARELWTSAGAGLSALRTTLGRMHVLDDLGRHREAIEAGTELLEALDDTDVDPDTVAWLRAAALENRGVSLGYLGEHRVAIEAYALAEDAYRQCGSPEDVARATANRGVELIELGRLDAAIDALAEAAASFGEDGDDVSHARCLAYTARAQLRAGNFVAALTATDEAEEYLAMVAASTELLRTQLVRAETLAALNLVEEAEHLHRSIIDDCSDAGLDHDRAVAQLGLGTLLGRVERTGEAGALLAAARESFEAIGDEPMAAVATLRLAEIASDEDRAGAVRHALKSLRDTGRTRDIVEALIRLANTTGDVAEADARLAEAADLLHEQPLPHLQWQLDHARGHRHRDAGRDADAMAAFRRAVDGIEAIRDTVEAEAHRLPFMAYRDRPHQDLLAGLLRQSDETAAFALVEQMRARTLVERLAARHGGAPDPLTPRAVPTAPAGLAQTVVYQFLGDELLAFVVRDGAVAVIRDLSPPAQVLASLARLDSQWRRFDDRSLAARHKQHLLATSLDVLQALWIDLLAPLERHLDEGAVTVVPHGVLSNVPFAALHDGTSFLIDRFTFSFAPSITAAQSAHQRSRAGERALIAGVADHRAPHILRETEALASLLPQSHVLTGTAATAAAVVDRMNDHDVIHLACHGVHRVDNPLFSSLTLGDGPLTAAEVASLDLEGQLVVLSACSTARQQHAGTRDELVGLPRAFLAAGAGAVVVNLWQVDDASSVEVMTEFHRRLGTDDVASALRYAQLDMRSREPHPFFWAPGVAYGSPTTWRRTP